MNMQKSPLSSTELMVVEQEAKQIVLKVAAADPVNLEVLTNEIGRLGTQTQEKAGQTLRMLDRPVNELMNGKNKEITGSLLKLRSEVDVLNESKQAGFLQRILRRNPLTNYIQKYQSVKTNIDAILASLRNGKDTLEENMVHMNQLRKSSAEEVQALQHKIALGNKLFELLEADMGLPGNEVKKPTYERVLRKVTTRIQSMTEMIMLYDQAIAGTFIINDNNDKLIDAVDSAIDKTANLITVSAMISMALQDQANTIQAVNATNQTLETMFKDNARLIKTTTEDTTKLLEKPAMSMEAINQATNDLLEALDMSQQSNRRIIQSNMEFVGKMNEINQKVTTRLGLDAADRDAAQRLPDHELGTLLK